MSWPKAIVGFFLVIAAVNAFVVYSAVSSRTALIEDQPYERGLKYDEVIKQLSQAESSGIKSNIELTKLGQQDYKLSVTFSSNEDIGITEKDQVSVSLKHPAAMSNEDIYLSLKMTAPGVFSSELKPSRFGFWLIEVSATRHGKKLLWKDSLVIE